MPDEPMTDEQTDLDASTPERRTLDDRRQAVVNLWDFLVKGGLADQTRTPSHVIDSGRTRELHRYEPIQDVPTSGIPVLLVPPLGSQAACFDLRPGLSLAEDLVKKGRPTYLVDYGPLKGEDRALGVEHFINDVLPPAIRAVSEDAGGRPVHLVGWCMGGLLSLGTAAVHQDLPIQSVSMIASPFDFSSNPLLKPFQVLGKVTGGRIVGSALKAAGSIPAPLVSAGFKATALPTYLKKPRTLWSRRDDREFLTQIQAVDHIMNNMLAYPGRATLQVYQRLALRNELASGQIQGPNHLVDLADVAVPVMNIAGTEDVLVPSKAAHHVGGLLASSPDVRLPLAPGGHLGVLTGTRAPYSTWVLVHDFLADHDEAKAHTAA